MKISTTTYWLFRIIVLVEVLLLLRANETLKIKIFLQTSKTTLSHYVLIEKWVHKTTHSFYQPCHCANFYTISNISRSISYIVDRRFSNYCMYDIFQSQKINCFLTKLFITIRLEFYNKNLNSGNKNCCFSFTKYLKRKCEIWILVMPAAA